MRSCLQRSSASAALLYAALADEGSAFAVAGRRDGRLHIELLMAFILFHSLLAETVASRGSP